MKFRWKNIEFSMRLEVIGQAFELDIIPFRWSKLAYRSPKNCVSPLMREGICWHWFGGPLHIHASGGWSKAFLLSFDVGQHPFHGGAIQEKKGDQS